jgi:hypothetical protein
MTFNLILQPAYDIATWKEDADLTHEGICQTPNVTSVQGVCSCALLVPQLLKVMYAFWYLVMTEEFWIT